MKEEEARIIIKMDEMKILFEIEKNNNKVNHNFKAGIAKDLGLNWCYISVVMKRFENIGLITTSKQGRIKFIKLEKRGQELIKLVKQIMELK
jgi:DNA-binding MarR family transcriptional regulator